MSDYTGDVAVGGPAQTRELTRLRITKMAVGPSNNNAYLLECRATGALVLVDAAAEADRLLGLVSGRPLSRIVTTHRHPDHWQALSALVEATGAPVAAHPADAAALPVPVSEPVADGDEVAVGDVRLRAIHLVGHTPGSIALHLGEDGGHLLTGDSLFPGGPGNTDGDATRFTSLLDDLESKVFALLPDSTTVYPGHGADTTLGAQRPSVAEWRARGW